MSNILIVDDKIDNVYYLSALLSAHGHNVASAQNGREALDYAHRTPPDLVISDLLMPVMDGYTLLGKWKADPRLNRVGFIVYTGTYISPADEKLARELGADAFIVKPTEPDDMMACIRTVLEKADRIAPAAAPDGTLDPTILTQYNAVLVHKLEDKMIELEASNRSLRAEIEERKRQSHIRDAIVNSLPAQIALLDNDGTILAVNNTWIAFAEQNGGKAFGPMIGSNYLSYCDHADAVGLTDMAKISNGIRQVISGEVSTFITEYPYGSPDQVLWFRVIVSPLKQPQINGVIVTHFNVTDVKEAEERSRKTSERLSLALDAASIGIWEWTPGKPIIWDNRMYDLYGIPHGEPVDFARWSSRLHPDEVETAEETIARITAAGGRRERQFRITLPNGALHHIVETEKAISRAGSQDITYVGTNVDITERLALEEQLRQSQRLEAVGKMTGGVAHDFNNLLTIIMGNAELLEGALAGSPRLQALAEMIVGAAERGAKLSSQLLSFSRRQMLDPRAVDVNALLVRLEGLLKRAVGSQIVVYFRYAPELWTALIDASGLENALLNLSVNARDAMPNGGTLLIETRNVDVKKAETGHLAEVAVGQYVVIGVSDTGTGMDERTRLRAFDPFFTTKDVGKGSGLGLSMVHGFISQSRGQVTVESELGKGTTFELYLPRCEEVEAPQVAVTQKVEPAQSRESILVVEDDDVLRAQVCAQLTDLGYQVVSAQDGVEAMEILKTRSGFDLLFTDVIMPRGMSGQQLAIAARQLQPGLPVLFTSGFKGDAVSDTDRLAEEGNFLQKPYRKKALAEMVRRVLDAKR